ncbi:MAG: DUF4271 domain-containing protein [Bacteroidales bacterium]|nr:DUF4271 domain-containing protein [Bacteroidales bacterium]
MFFISQILIFIRVFKTSNKTKFSILHMFLYLCTLEIVPVLFIGKISGLFS